MHVDFTDNEMRYLVREPFNWHPSDDAPDDVRESIEAKLSLIDGQMVLMPIGPVEAHPNA